MSEQQYKALGWILFIATVLLAAYMCLYEKGVAGAIMTFTARATGHRLAQLAWLITFAIVCLPGWAIKNYFEGLAWNAHVEKLPPPDIRQSAKKSKYVDASLAPAPVRKPVRLENVAKEQQEFIATCPACGGLFPANKKQIGPTKCPSCGEVVPIA